MSVGGNHDKTQLERKQNNNYNDSNNEMQPWNSRQGKKKTNTRIMESGSLVRATEGIA